MPRQTLANFLLFSTTFFIQKTGLSFFGTALVGGPQGTEVYGHAGVLDWRPHSSSAAVVFAAILLSLVSTRLTTITDFHAFGKVKSATATTTTTLLKVYSDTNQGRYTTRHKILP